MISVLLITGNEREEQILKMAFGQLGVKVVTGKPGYHNYVKLQQYVPDAVIMEFPRIHMDELHLTKLVRSHKRTQKIPIIGYGNAADDAIVRGVLSKGVNNYLTRPLKFSNVLSLLKDHLRRNQKTLDIHKEEHNRDKDMDLLLSDSTLPTQKIEIISSYVSKLLAFPFTVAKVLQISQDGKTGASDLARAIEADPVISTHLLRVGNSVFFASANRRISSVKDSIVRIGFNETKRIVMTMSVMKLVQTQNRGIGFDRIDFWYHSLATGVIASALARYLGTVNTEEAFLAGLLHDFGILIFDEFFPNIFMTAIDQTTEKECEFIDTVRKLLKITHNDVIAELFPIWKIPDSITDGIVLQYDFKALTDSADTPGKKIALCVGIGNVLAKTLHLGRECDQYIKPVPNKTLGALRLLSGFTKSFIDKVYQEIALFRQLLELEDRDVPFGSEGLLTADRTMVGIANPGSDIFVPPSYYLDKAGFKVVQITGTDSLNKYDLQFDIILFWDNGTQTAETVTEYAGIVRKYEEAPAGESDLDKVPILVFCGSDSALMSSDMPENIKFMSKEMELRNLDKKLYSMVLESSEARDAVAQAVSDKDD